MYMLILTRLHFNIELISQHSMKSINNKNYGRTMELPNGCLY